MSEENIRAARQMIDAWNRGDIDGWARGLDDDVVWVPLAENPETEPVQGREATREFVLDWVGPWDEYTVDVTKVVDHGDWVVLGAHHDAKHESGAEISMDMWVAANYRDGRGVEFRWFTNETDALRTVGIADTSSG
jgi:ketosteroid isomerase-like protein